MKTAELKSSAANARSNAPFFSKEGADDYGDHAEEPFFSGCAQDKAVQTKLTVGPSDDKYEKEADSVADAVVHNMNTRPATPGHLSSVQTKPSVTPLLQTKCSECEEGEKQQEKEKDKKHSGLQRKPIFESNEEPEEETLQMKCDHCEKEDKKLQRKSDGTAAPAPASVVAGLNSSSGSGSPLSPETNSSMSSAFGRDFSHVRVHTDQQAAAMNKELNAQAFTHGNDIYFGQGKYSANDTAGKHLLAHELTHTIQQTGGVNTKKIQRNGTTPSTTTTTPVPGTVLTGPPYILNGNEFIPNGSPPTLKLSKISLPDFKKRNEDKFKWPLYTLKGRPPTKQVKNWEDGVKSATNAKVAAFLNGIQKPAGDVYFLKSKQTEYRLFGTKEQIQAYCYIPEWNRTGNKNIHEVDHILEMQLGGADEMNNYELADSLANGTSGNNIKNERLNRIKVALNEFKLAGVPSVPTAEVVSDTYIVTFGAIDKWDLSYKGDGKVYWKRKDIEDGLHLNHLRGMTAEEIAKSQGTANELVIYVNERSGSPLRIPIPFPGKISNWLPGIDLTACTHNPGAADGKAFGSLSVQLRNDFTDSLKASDAFKIGFNKTPGLLNTGYLTFTKDQRAIGDLLRVEGLSPVVIDEFRLDEKLGIVMRGRIKTDLPLLAGAEIDLSMSGKNIMISKTFSLGDVKSFPKPFKVTDISLGIFASTEFGFGVEGNIDFEVANLGKGSVKGIGATKDGFVVKGKFDFDSKKFEGSNVSFEYRDKKWTIGGELIVKKGNFKGIENANLTVKYAEEKITAKGKAKLDVPGIDDVTLDATIDTKGNFSVKGDAKLKKMPGIKSGSLTVGITKDNTEFNLTLGGTASPDIPKMPKELDAQFTISYDSKTDVFKAAADFKYKKGRVDVKVLIGVTNAAVANGVLQESKGDKLVMYGTGEITVTLIENKVTGKFKAVVKPTGELFISGVATLVPTPLMDPFKKEKTVGFPALKIPVIGVPMISIFLEIGGGVKFYFNWDPLTISGDVTLPETDITKLDQATIGMNVKANSKATAGVGMEISAKIGAQAIALVVSGGVSGFAGLEITGNIGAGLKTEFSLDKGLVLKSLDAEISVKPTAKFSLTGVIGVYLDLFFSKVNIWEWKKQLAEGSVDLSNLGGFKITVPVKFDDKGKVILPSLEQIQVEKPEFSADKGKELMEGVFNDNQKQKPAEEDIARQRIQDAIEQDVRKRLAGNVSHNVFAHARDVENKFKGKNAELNEFITKTVRFSIMGVSSEAFDKMKNDLLNSKASLASKLAVVDEYERHWYTFYDKTATPLLREELRLQSSQQGSSVQRKPIFESENEEAAHLQRQGIPGSTPVVTPHVESSIESSSGKGESLPAETQQEMGTAMGADLSDVNIHSDASAASLSDALNAKAFTHGKDIYFNRDKYDTESTAGKHLLAHELAHVVQQEDGETNTHKVQRDPQKGPPPAGKTQAKPGSIPIVTSGNPPPGSSPIILKPSNPITITGSQGSYSGGVSPDVVKPGDWLPFKMESGGEPWESYLKQFQSDLGAIIGVTESKIDSRIAPPFVSPSGKDLANQVVFSSGAEVKSVFGSIKSDTNLKAEYDFTTYKWIPTYEGIVLPDPATYSKIAYPVQVHYAQRIEYSDSNNRKLIIVVSADGYFTPEKWLDAIRFSAIPIPANAILGYKANRVKFHWTIYGRGDKFGYGFEADSFGENTSISDLTSMPIQLEYFDSPLPPITFLRPYTTPAKQFVEIMKFLDAADKNANDYMAKHPPQKVSYGGGGVVNVSGNLADKADNKDSGSSMPGWLQAILGVVVGAVLVVGVILLLPYAAAGLVAVAGAAGIALSIKAATAIIVGGLLLAGFINSLRHRIKEAKGKVGFFKILGVSLLDTIGIGALIECVTDESLLTGDKLNQSAFGRAFGCTTGILTFLATAKGAFDYFGKAPAPGSIPDPVPAPVDTPPVPAPAQPSSPKSVTPPADPVPAPAQPSAPKSIIPPADTVPAPAQPSAPKSVTPPADPAPAPRKSKTPDTPPKASVVEPPEAVPWPPKPPVGEKPPVDAPNAAKWRYQRYVYDKFLEGAKQSDILSPEVWMQRYFNPTASGGRPGRRGGPAQVSAKDALQGEGIIIAENIKLGSRYPDGVSPTPNPKGGKDYFEVGKMLKDKIPESRERIKIQEEIDAMGQNDTITFVDSANPANRVTYTKGSKADAPSSRTF